MNRELVSKFAKGFFKPHKVAPYASAFTAAGLALITLGNYLIDDKVTSFCGELVTTFGTLSLLEAYTHNFRALNNIIRHRRVDKKYYSKLGTPCSKIAYETAAIDSGLERELEKIKHEVCRRQ